MAMFFKGGFVKKEKDGRKRRRLYRGPLWPTKTKIFTLWFIVEIVYQFWIYLV